jgi:DNA-binding NtrC family response regulator
MSDTRRLKVDSVSLRGFQVRVTPAARRLSAPPPVTPDGEGRLRVGRGPSAGVASAPGWLRVDDPTVSRAHVELIAASGAVCVRDMSTNGTWINGVKIMGCPVEVFDDAELRVGQSLLRLELDPADRALAVSSARTFGDLLGESAPMRRVFDRARKVAGHDVPVLITGETGTGKSRLARAIHGHSRRAEGGFKVIDCGALSPTLLESELFGHVKGAFTHATSDRRGLFEDADGGTVFLDEVAELSAEAQTRLLRVLDERVVRRVGDNVDRSVNVRVVAATHQNLAARVNEGRFRLDLYERLAGVTVEIPALRERRDDIPPLAEALLTRIRARGDVQVPADFSLPDFTAKDFETRLWAGNVRELQHYLESLIITDEPPPERPSQVPLPPDASLAYRDLLDLPHDEALNDLRLRFNHVYLRRVLRLAKGRVKDAAARAGLHRVTFARLRDECGLARGNAPDDDE